MIHRKSWVDINYAKLKQPKKKINIYLIYIIFQKIIYSRKKWVSGYRKTGVGKRKDVNKRISYRVISGQ